MAEPVVESSGNVFSDLGFETAEATILHIRAMLLSDLREYIRSRGMTIAEISETLEIGPSRASDLLQGRWDRFSLEMLITLAARAGLSVKLELAA